MELEDKFIKLKNIIKELESVAIAFSGGVDSTFLIKIAHDVLDRKSTRLNSSHH